MKIENVSWIGFSAWWSSQKKGHLSVSDCLFRKIVIDNKSVHSVVSEILSNSTSWIGSQELKWSWIWCSSSDDYSVVHSSSLFKSSYNISYCWSLLSNSSVNAIKFFIFIIFVKIFLLIDNCINCNCCFSSLPISNNQLSLSSSDWHKRVNTLKSSLHGFVYWFSRNYTWGFKFNSLSLVRFNSSESIYWVTKGVNDSSE